MQRIWRYVAGITSQGARRGFARDDRFPGEPWLAGEEGNRRVDESPGELGDSRHAAEPTDALGPRGLDRGRGFPARAFFAALGRIERPRMGVPLAGPGTRFGLEPNRSRLIQRRPGPLAVRRMLLRHFHRALLRASRMRDSAGVCKRAAKSEGVRSRRLCRLDPAERGIVRRIRRKSTRTTRPIRVGQQPNARSRTIRG